MSRVIQRGSRSLSEKGSFLSDQRPTLRHGSGQATNNQRPRRSHHIAWQKWRSVRRQWRWLPAIALLAAVLVACGGSGLTQTSQTQRYQLQLTLDGIGFGQRTATIEVHDSSGQPVAADQVVLAPVMQQMGMAAPEIVAQSVAPGRYQAQGEFFSMLGPWEVDVRVSAGGSEDVGRFTVQVDQP